MKSSVGSFEAKTHLPALLERVAKGERITITRRGVSFGRIEHNSHGPVDTTRPVAARAV